MSAWDKKAWETAARRHTIPPTQRGVFAGGAEWQRKALLADDVIERAARAVYNHQVPAGLKCLTIQWEEAHETQRDHFLSVARVALTAALGIEGDEA